MRTRGIYITHIRVACVIYMYMCWLFTLSLLVWAPSCTLHLHCTDDAVLLLVLYCQPMPYIEQQWSLWLLI